MTNIISGSNILHLAEPDAGGNVGYSLSYDFKYQKENPSDSIEYSNIKFSGPGSWDDYSEGSDYPYSQMLELALSEH